MTPRIGNIARDLDAELEQLAFSAYLLTLDAGAALSAVMAALDASLEDLDASSDLQLSTIKLSLKRLRSEADLAADHESSVYDALLYGNANGTSSLLSLWKKEPASNAIASLGTRSRVAFVLHHVLAYKVEEAAALAGVDEKRFRAQLRRAYVELAAYELGANPYSSDVLAESALA